MANAIEVEEFIQKWEPAILEALTSIGEAAAVAGYGVYPPEGDVDLPEDIIGWAMPIFQRKRPESLDSLDLFVTFSLATDAADPLTAIPFVGFFDPDGNPISKIFISDSLELSDTSAWHQVLAIVRGKAAEVVNFLKEYSPKPTKPLWKIYVTTPDKLQLHPSIHSNEEIAKDETSIRLTWMIDKIKNISENDPFWLLAGWGEWDSHRIDTILAYLDEGEVWVALREYHSLLQSISDLLLIIVTEIVGSLTVERVGG